MYNRKCIVESVGSVNRKSKIQFLRLKMIPRRLAWCRKFENLIFAGATLQVAFGIF